VLAPNDSVELHNLPLVLHMPCKKREDTGEIGNEIRGYSKKEPPPVNTQAPASSPPLEALVMFEVELPWPPSINHYWRRVGRHTPISRTGRKWAVAARSAGRGRGSLMNPLDFARTLPSVAPRGD
jgi:hypothetical protein